MALIMDLMLPWRPSTPARKNITLIFKESQNTDVKLNLSEISAKAHMTCLKSLERTA